MHWECCGIVFLEHQLNLINTFIVFINVIKFIGIFSITFCSHQMETGARRCGDGAHRIQRYALLIEIEENKLRFAYAH